VEFELDYDGGEFQCRLSKKKPSRTIRPVGRRWSEFLQPSARHQFTLRDHGYRASASHNVPVYVAAVTCRWYSLRLLTEGWPG